MALAAAKTFLPGEVLYASDLNALNTNILNNPISLVSPWTASMDANGFDLTALDETGFNDASANATVAGRLRRNSTNLTWHDGSAAGRIFYAGGTDVPVADGGTGLSAGTSGGIPYFSSTTAIASSALLTQFGLIYGGGAGATPVALGAMTNGQIVIGSTGVAPVAAAPTALTGGGVTITTGAGSLTFSVAWLDQLTGLRLTNGTDATNDIDIAVGAAASDDAAIANRLLMSLTSVLTKQLDAAWAVGTNQGGLDTGSIANTTYHIFLIQRTDTGVVDALFSTSATAPTMPANYTKQRRIGSILRESGTIIPFTQDADLFQRTTPVLDITAAAPGSSAVTRTLSVPLGINVLALVNVLIEGAGNSLCYLSDLAVTDSAPSQSAAPLSTTPTAGIDGIGVGGQAMIRTNTSAQIRSRLSSGGAGETLFIATCGWIDRRGRG